MQGRFWYGRLHNLQYPKVPSRLLFLGLFLRRTCLIFLISPAPPGQQAAGNSQLVAGNSQLVAGNSQLVAGNSQLVAGSYCLRKLLEFLIVFLKEEDLMLPMRFLSQFFTVVFLSTCKLPKYGSK
jgi:X-X-X-Leu-X-X-Gly heptad repeat protein